jgi:pilus assembly protein Flp/PilA
MLARIKKAGHALGRDAAGVTAVEYGLIAGAVAIAIIGAVFLIGGDIADIFTRAGTAIGSGSK